MEREFKPNLNLRNDGGKNPKFKGNGRLLNGSGRGTKLEEDTPGSIPNNRKLLSGTSRARDDTYGAHDMPGQSI